jgi:hypothetical protein
VSVFGRQHTPLATAIAAELAADQRSRQYPSSITEDDALKHISTNELIEWLGWMSVDTSWRCVLTDLLSDVDHASVEKILTALLHDVDARTVLSQAVLSSTHSLGHVLSAALRSRVAKRIADIANDMADDPTDYDMERPCNPALMDRINARYGS